MIKFRDLTADDIEVRVAQCNQNWGVQLLLYKNARVDMNILDETVGVENWQRKHYECKGNLYCSLGINVNFDKPDSLPLWIWKDDCGAESNTEKEKGESSDSFKRAATNFGIGRELYTSPKFICFKPEDVTWKDGKCKDSFSVHAIRIENKKIVGLQIINNKTKKGITYGSI